jgi:hypothetical protein
MNKSALELLQEYRNIIAEGDLGNPHNNTAFDEDEETGDGGWEPTDDNLGYDKEGGPMRDAINSNDDENAIDLPDESMMDDEKPAFENNWDDPEIPDSNPADPVGELANFLKTDADKITQFLKQHNLELTSVGGLANSKGNI